MRGCLCVVLAVVLGAVVALPAPKTLERLQGALLIEDEHMIDKNLCAGSVLTDFFVRVRSKEGYEAGCPTTLQQAIRGENPLMSDVCACHEVIENGIPNIYSHEFDCVVSEGIWNIRQVARLCHHLPEESTGETAQKAIRKLQTKDCVMDSSCFHGKCVQNICVCRRSNDSNNQPLYRGEDCSLPWCFNECSGHGVCNVSSGICLCNAGYSGDGCNVPHKQTLATEIPPPTLEKGEVDHATPAPPRKPLTGMCWAEHARITTIIENLPFGESAPEFPTCNSLNGAWMPLQCSDKRKLCWCVNEAGVAYEESYTPIDKPPPCKGFAGYKVEPLKFEFNIKRTIAKDLCGFIACGPNGYCQISTVSAEANRTLSNATTPNTTTTTTEKNNNNDPIAVCRCIGGYFGKHCEIAPSASPSPTISISPSPSPSTSFSSSATVSPSVSLSPSLTVSNSASLQPSPSPTPSISVVTVVVADEKSG